MEYILFIYGLAFFSMGIAISLYPKGISSFRLSEEMFWIGMFGVIHGTSEWIDMFMIIEQGRFALGSFINALLVPLSFLFLLFFGLRSLSSQGINISNRLIFTMMAVPAIAFLLLVCQTQNPLQESNILARYLLGAPGIFLTAYIFYKEMLLNRGTPLINARKYLLVLSLSFFAYGIFAGLVVPAATWFPASYLNYASFYKNVGVPVQLFRSLCAVTAALAAIRLLTVFRNEAEITLSLLSQAVRQSGDSVIITDKDGIIEYVNPTFERLTGYSSKEAIGQKPNIISSGEHPISFYQNIWTTILAGNTFRDYLTNKKKIGELYYEFKAIAPIKNKNGEISHFVATGKDITTEVLMRKKLEELAATDKLTGLANRMKFDEMMCIALEWAKRYEEDLSVTLFDIDDFKKVNDVHGHLAGDEVLKKVAQIGQEIIRTSDLIARWGGEEFIILQPNTSAQQAKVLAERLRQTIASSTFENVGQITVSSGITSFQAGDDIDTLLKRVDDALYMAKGSGKNCVSVK